MSEVITDKLTGRATANDVTVTVGATATQSLEQGLCKSFAVYGEDTVVDNSLNIASLTDVGTGATDHNYTNDFSSAESYTVAIACIPGTDVAERPRLSVAYSNSTRTINEEVDTSTDRDADQFYFSTFGDLA